MQLLLFRISNFIVNLTSIGLLGETEDKPVTKEGWYTGIVQPILNLLENLLLPIIIIVGTAGSIYAIVLGVNYARAETSDKREEAKGRMINAIVGLVAMVFLLILLQLVVTNAEDIVSFIRGVGTNKS